MSLDVQYFTKCDHYVSGKVYREDMCPRCYGKGYYLDINFGPAGEAIVIGGVIKLQQEVLKAVLDERYSDPFASAWGSEVHLFFGHKKMAITKARLEIAVRRAVEHLKAVQEQEIEYNDTMTMEEIIDNIKWMQIEPISVLGWNIRIAFTNKEETILEQTVIF